MAMAQARTLLLSLMLTAAAAVPALAHDSTTETSRGSESSASKAENSPDTNLRRHPVKPTHGARVRTAHKTAEGSPDTNLEQRVPPPRERPVNQPPPDSEHSPDNNDTPPER